MVQIFLIFALLYNSAKIWRSRKCRTSKINEEAYSFYSGQILQDARRQAKVTQAELAKKVGINKSYISKIENGVIEPGVGLFFRLIDALGLRFSIVNPMM